MSHVENGLPEAPATIPELNLELGLMGRTILGFVGIIVTFAWVQHLVVSPLA